MEIDVVCSGGQGERWSEQSRDLRIVADKEEDDQY